MNVVITGRHFDVTDSIKEHAKGKLAKLDKFFSKILEAHVILSVEKYRHVAEITVIGKNLKITATETTSDMYASIDKAVESLDKQMRKFSERVKEHKIKQARKVKEEALRLFSTVAGYFGGSAAKQNPKIVETKRLMEKPMSVDEAADELDISKGEFLVFRNSSDDQLNVIYKRKDGNFGLIKP